MMQTRTVLRWTTEEAPATGTAPRQVWLRAVWDELPVAWAGSPDAAQDPYDRSDPRRSAGI